MSWPLNNNMIRDRELNISKAARLSFLHFHLGSWSKKGNLKEWQKRWLKFKCFISKETGNRFGVWFFF